MTYLIKHPIVRKTPKFALVYKNSTSYTFPIGGARSDNFQLDTIVQSDGMGLSVSSNAIVLQEKRYYVECRATVSIAETYYATTEIQINGITVPMSVIAKTNSYLVYTPITVATAVINASAGDQLTFKHTRSISVVSGPIIYGLYNKFIIMEII